MSGSLGGAEVGRLGTKGGVRLRFWFESPDSLEKLVKNCQMLCVCVPVEGELSGNRQNAEMGRELRLL